MTGISLHSGSDLRLKRLGLQTFIHKAANFQKNGSDGEVVVYDYGDAVVGQEWLQFCHQLLGEAGFVRD